jgi:DNA mismatch endonuclease, patch repair protein
VKRPIPSSYTAQRTMQANRRADTRPELAVRSALHARGLRFRKDYPIPIPGRRATRVDVVFISARVAVFVDGCFWHGCPEHGLTPKSNAAYWVPKLERNRERDQRVTEGLEADGWTVVRVWEHEPVREAVARIALAVQDR